MNKIIIKQGDITTAPVDVIVNAANPKMLGGGGVDGAIHKAAGPKLLEECRKVKSINGIRCPFGEARITPGCDLKAKYVIHTVGPRYRIDADPEKLLNSAYQKSLNLAISNQCNSIAFPAISCGAYGYPVIEASKIAISVCQRTTYKEFTIYFYLFNKKIAEIWTATLEKMNS